MANRLARAMSPYLQQHADNPVDWHEWGPEAFAEARRRDVPLLLSVGYAACHWCHVMAHESFEDPAVAALMNEHFVNVKVDREERPDIDSLYLTATQAMTGQGGWPMTVFLAPDGRPFHAGTYYPPRPLPPTPSFPQLLTAVTGAWRERRGELEQVADAVTQVLRRASASTTTTTASTASTAADIPGGTAGPSTPPCSGPLCWPWPGWRTGATAASAALRSSAVLVRAFLLRHAARRRLDRDATTGGPDDTGTLALDMAGRVLRAMARSGMYDQVAGGFARYAVDEAWTVPHSRRCSPTTPCWPGSTWTGGG